MTRITILPGTAVVDKDDFISEFKLYYAHLGYSEEESHELASERYGRILHDKLHQEAVGDRKNNIKDISKKAIEGGLYHLENIFDVAREKYKPKHVKCLLIAEAPPSKESGRFFYFENVNDGDSLFLETMKVLYSNEYDNAKQVRSQKELFLKRFMAEGFYLIDATDSPMPGYTRSEKERQVKKSLPELIGKAKKLAGDDIPTILISATVYQVCEKPLKAAGLKVVNTEMIDFPGSGRQNIFRAKMTKLLKSLGVLNV